MHKIKRLLTNDELDTFLKLREESNIKASKYMKSLEHELFEVTDENYGRKQRSIKTTKD